MSGYALTPLAKADVFEVWSYIAAHSEDAADRVEQAIYDACAFIAEAPLYAGRIQTRFRLWLLCTGREIFAAS